MSFLGHGPACGLHFVAMPALLRPIFMHTAINMECVLASGLVPCSRYVDRHESAHSTNQICGTCRSAPKELAAGEVCRRVKFAEVDDLVYNQLKIPHYQLDLLGIHTVSRCHLSQLSHRVAAQWLSPQMSTWGAALSEGKNSLALVG